MLRLRRGGYYRHPPVNLSDAKDGVTIVSIHKRGAAHLVTMRCKGVVSYMRIYDATDEMDAYRQTVAMLRQKNIPILTEEEGE